MFSLFVGVCTAWSRPPAEPDLSGMIKRCMLEDTSSVDALLESRSRGVKVDEPEIWELVRGIVPYHWSAWSLSAEKEFPVVFVGISGEVTIQMQREFRRSGFARKTPAIVDEKSGGLSCQTFFLSEFSLHRLYNQMSETVDDIFDVVEFHKTWTSGGRGRHIGIFFNVVHWSVYIDENFYYLHLVCEVQDEFGPRLCSVSVGKRAREYHWRLVAGD